ncbi:DNA replication licensing factor MCM6, putative [Theileria equi strain WA]|uniref:DNA replication licensing factor MCM6 n=1 Tax=Theileria equi strain WA TaxID=1537102 RepID=L0AVF1_THEEQ|nr:DNA replication licensing factor MCM6, putative [Theileria equi strain WA]AFZ78991.1 DNA replication licensing factor MCM6, putative [Theileria equi strain WA]|eukprot:XP_004828657.1 DNA replication licensing factor MCM6, putative [Theileria equi strain WA]
MDQEDANYHNQSGLNTLQNMSQLPHTSSLNDFDLNDDEEAPHVQDSNIARVFDYFLRSYVHSNVSDFDEGDDTDDEGLNDVYYLTGDHTQELYYMKRIYKLILKESSSTEVLSIHLDHILNWNHIELDTPLNLNMQLYRYLVKNFLRMQETLEDVLQTLVDEISNSVSRTSRRFYLQFLHTPSIIYPLREIRCNMLGELITIRGQVTRISDVRPELVRGTFKCKSCGNIVSDVIQQFKYTTPLKCISSTCLNMREWELLMDRSYFCDWQKIRIQEIAQEAESGSIPSSIEVILRNHLVDSLNAGDRVEISGSLIVLPDVPTLMKPGEIPKKVAKEGIRRFESFLLSQGITGIKGVGIKDLNHKLSFLATQIRRVNQYKSTAPQMTETLEDRLIRAEDILNIPGFEWIKEIATGPDTIEKLASCIAPKVWGHMEIKKGILLMMVGGVHKSSTNSKLRGDINMCIVGDPSTAKSQFLKFVEDFAPRAIFASGKGSTAAGLTAAVHKDPDNGDYILEAGALMYADEGICCIDEFDKMNEKDRVAIHEAMEQQTISITKAGIQAILNARASVLAACNPRFGRYDSSKSFASNVNLPSPLLSRFDLLYTMIDESVSDVDSKIAWHITSLHGPGVFKSSQILLEENSRDESYFENEIETLLTRDELKLYIELAKRGKPLIQDSAKQRLAQYYVELRNGDVQTGKRSLRMTVRQLESLVRLSEAVARLKFSDFVEELHVEEAYSIFRASLSKLSNKNDILLEPIASALKEQKDSAEPLDLDKESTNTTDNSSSDKPADIENDSNLRISTNEYEAISAVILDYVNECELVENIVRSNELIEWYLENILVPTSSEQANLWNLRLQRILYRLVYIDNKLIASHNPEDPENVFRLRVHPNYFSSTHLWSRENLIPGNDDDSSDGVDFSSL